MSNRSREMIKRLRMNRFTKCSFCAEPPIIVLKNETKGTILAYCAVHLKSEAERKKRNDTAEQRSDFQNS